MTYKILGICGSLRAASIHRDLLGTLPDLFPEDVDFTIHPTIGDIPLYNQELDGDTKPAPATALRDAVDAADGVVIASPSYNYSIAGTTKNALDWVSRFEDQPFCDKPVSIMTASPSSFGGIRSQYDLRKVLVFFQAHVVNQPEVAIPNAYDKFEGGKLIDARSRKVVTKHLKAFLEIVAATRGMSGENKTVKDHKKGPPGK